jgi:hypothetical protein
MTATDFLIPIPQIALTNHSLGASSSLNLHLLLPYSRSRPSLPTNNIPRPVGAIPQNRNLPQLSFLLQSP